MKRLLTAGLSNVCALKLNDAWREQSGIKRLSNRVITRSDDDVCWFRLVDISAVIMKI